MTRTLLLEECDRPIVGADHGHEIALPASIESRGEVIRRLAMVVALYSLPAIVVMQPVTDLDIWWHLRTGQWIVDHRAVPTTDPFSSFGLGKPWVAYGWLFELLVFGLYRWLGILGIVVYRAVLTLAVAVAIHRLVARREPRFGVALGLAGAAIFAIIPLMSERPWLFTILFSTLTLDVVLDLRAGRNPRATWLLPPLFALWANLHIQFVYGLALLALSCAAPLADRLLGIGTRDGQASSVGSPAWWRLVTLFAACLMATLLNPYHGRLYAVILGLGSQPVAYNRISELAAMEFRRPWDWTVLALVVASAFVLGRRSRPSLFSVFMLIISAYVSFRSLRDAWLVVLASLAILLPVRRPVVPVGDRFPLTWSRILIVAGAIALVLVVTGWGRNLSERHLHEVVAASFPDRAAAVVEERGYAGPLYNHFNWGGYLIWRLPGLPVSMDGRMNVHGDDRLERSFETWAGQRGWDSDPDLKSSGLVIAESKGTLTSLLRLDPRYELVHEDPTAVVFVARKMNGTP